MGDGTGYRRDARGLKAFSPLFVLLVAASLLLVHAPSYDPPVSFVPLYLVASVGVVVAAVVVPLLPAEQFTGGFCGGMYALYAAVVAMMVFFTGGVSSDLYVTLFPLVFASALHGAWRLVLAVLAAALFCYGLAVLPALLESGTGEDAAASVFYRLGVLALTRLSLAYASRSVIGTGASENRGLAEEGEAVLVEQLDEEISAPGDAPVAVILVDPGDIRDLDLLLDRVEARVGETVPLAAGNLFGMVVGGADDGGAESVARRTLAAASSLGAGEPRAGAAIYPRDAGSAQDLLAAAGRALEASLEVEGPSAVVIPGKNAPEGRYRATH